ncbi:MAG: efflux RND transporter periplasmic adaptor subunit [Hyphomonadaceae bacterium]
MDAQTPPFVLRQQDNAPEGEEEPPKKSRRIVYLTLGGIALGALAIYAVTHLGAREVETAAVDPRQSVTVIRAAAREFAPTIDISGEARPVRDIHVVAPASGVRILEILADEGQMVRQGQALARLDTAVSTAQTRAAEASVAEARAAAVRARGEYDRAEAIRDSGALSTEAIEQRRAAADAADARLAAAQAQLAETNARLAGGYVRAPISGLVIDRQATLGAPVDGQTLFRIAGDNQLEVAAQVAEADILALAVGQRATFRLIDGTEVDARLRRSASSIDPRTRTGEALFALPRNTRVRAGMFLRGNATLAPRNSLAVPQAAILYQNGEAYLYVVDQQNKVRRTNVRLGARDGSWVEIVQGLSAGARVAGAGAAFLQNGDEIRPIEAQPQQAPQRRAEDGDVLRGRSG